MHGKRTKAIADKALTVLLAAAYLTIFIAHDSLYEQLPVAAPRQGEDGNTLSAVDLHQEKSVSAAEHHCPFCSGFVDTHVDPLIGTIERSWLGVSSPATHLKVPPSRPFCRPRDPPSLPI